MNMTVTAKPHKARLNLRAAAPSLDSFEETYKTAYSHGLEAIYALETVDLKTVKKLHPSSLVLSQQPESPEDPKQETHVKEPQLEFNFGDGFNTWMKPLLGREPIQVLGLSPQAEAALCDQEVRLLADLFAEDLATIKPFRGMGQGHVDEIHIKLKEYLSGRSLLRTETVSFCSWVRSLMAEIEFKKAAAFLHTYGISDMIPLSPADNAEMRSASREKQQRWAEEVRGALQSDAVVNAVSKDWQCVVKAFLVPWMRQRYNVVTCDELKERMEQIAVETEWTEKAIAFFAETFFGGNQPWECFLHKVEEGVYCSDSELFDMACNVIERAQSYFYKPHIVYRYMDFLSLVSCELAKEWKSCPQGFLERLFRRYSAFRVLRGSNGDLEIALS